MVHFNNYLIGLHTADPPHRYSESLTLPEGPFPRPYPPSSGFNLIISETYERYAGSTFCLFPICTVLEYLYLPSFLGAGTACKGVRILAVLYRAAWSIRHVWVRKARGKAQARGGGNTEKEKQKAGKAREHGFVLEKTQIELAKREGLNRKG